MKVIKSFVFIALALFAFSAVAEASKIQYKFLKSEDSSVAGVYEVRDTAVVLSSKTMESLPREGVMPKGEGCFVWIDSFVLTFFYGVSYEVMSCGHFETRIKHDFNEGMLLWEALDIVVPVQNSNGAVRGECILSRAYWFGMNDRPVVVPTAIYRPMFCSLKG